MIQSSCARRLSADRLALAPPALRQGQQHRLVDQRVRDEAGNIRPRHQAVGEADREVAAAVAHRLDRVGRLQLVDDHVQLRKALPRTGSSPAAGAPSRRSGSRRSPARPWASRSAPFRSCSAASPPAMMVSAWAASRAPSAVRRTRRPTRSSSLARASRSRIASCCDTADEVSPNAAPTAVMVPRWASSRSRRRRARSNIKNI